MIKRTFLISINGEYELFTCGGNEIMIQVLWSRGINRI